MTMKGWLTIACLALMLIVEGMLSTSWAQMPTGVIPEELIESRVAEKPEDHAVRIVAGFLHFDAGRFPMAEGHFAKAASLTPNDPYDQAWLYMAQLRQDPKTSDESIRAFLKRTASGEFVYTDIAVLLGDISPEQAIERANATNDPGNICEANYYAAQRLLANGETDKAQQYLSDAIKTRQESFWEYKSADAHIKRLKN